MKARFVGDPRELESGKPLSRAPSEEWFDVPEGMEDKYRKNDHYETDGAPAKPAPKRARAAKPAAPKIETDGWEGDE
jgi:hypothetical protein